MKIVLSMLLVICLAWPTIAVSADSLQANCCQIYQETYYPEDGLRSVVLPGWGQWHQNRKKAATQFFVGEILLITGAVIANQFSDEAVFEPMTFIVPLVCVRMIGMYDAQYPPSKKIGPKVSHNNESLIWLASVRLNF